MLSHALSKALSCGPFLLGAGNLGVGGRTRYGAVGAGQMIIYLAIAAGAIAVVCAAIYLGCKLSHRRRYDSQGTLFRGLCRVHGLDSRTRRLLRQIASHWRLQHPSRLFTEPKFLDPARLPGGLRGQADKVASLRSQLLGESGPE